MPVPYMGSKRDSAQRIVNLIKAYCPDNKELYDVFCGGFAISEEATKQGFSVHSSDINGDIVALINEVIFGDCIDKKTGISIFDEPRFISRQDFEEAKKTQGWWAGYCRFIWSFGNNGDGYIFGRDVEPTKFAGHELVVNCNITPEITKIVPKMVCDKIIKLSDWHKRRIALSKFARANKDRFLELQQLQQLERVQQLEQLQRLEYDKVDIPAGVIIYCDPPYRQTATYKASGGSFDHDKFDNWCREKSKTNPVFVSEYNMPDDFECIFEFYRRQTLRTGGKTNNGNEKVFYLNNME